MIPAEVMSRIRRLQIYTNRIVNEILGGQYESVFKGQGMEFKEVRAYVPGDDIRAIDWNVTARTGHPHVKLLAEERELTVMLVVDASASGRFGSVQRFKSELAGELCAVLALSAIKNNDKVGLLIFTDRVERFVPPARGSKHVLRIIRDVLYHEAEGRGTDIASALRYLGGVFRRRAVVFVVSDFLDEGYETALRLAKRRHDVIAAVIEDEREEVLPDAGLVAIRDAESGREVLLDSGDLALKWAYEELAQERRRTREEIFRRAKVDAFSVRTSGGYVSVLYRFFRMRARRRRR